MLPAPYNITVWAGSTYSKHAVYLANGPGAFDLSNYTGQLTIRSAAGQPITYATPVTLGGPFGTIDISIPPIITSVILPGVYELTITDLVGNVTPLLSGSFIVKGIV